MSTPLSKIGRKYTMKLESVERQKTGTILSYIHNLIDIKDYHLAQQQAIQFFKCVQMFSSKPYSKS